jgi:acetyl esterase/lipase
MRIILAAMVVAALSAAAEGGAADAPQPPALTIDSDAAVHIPAVTVPFSSLASAGAKAAMLDYVARPWPSAPDIVQMRRNVEAYQAPELAQAKAMYPVESKPDTIGGVYTDAITPADGVAPRNKHRVLINLHGGGFLFGARITGALESIPVAAIGKIKVITVDYRQGPENKFPAASEDVAAVYRALLKQYAPRDIGIYGCSAGGMLTAESIAWFEKEKLPMPGAIGIFCASAGGWTGGDSGVLGPALDGNQPGALTGPHPTVTNVPYFSDANFDDPLVAPIRSASVLAKFPPTLIISATRDFALSSAVHTQAELTKLGVDAELHVWEGLDHSFFTNPAIPESREVWDVVVKFFDRKLGKG